MKDGKYSKVERKILERVAQSAYYIHLERGLFRGEYTVEEAQRYFRYAEEDAGGHCPTIFQADANVFTLYADYKLNKARLRYALGDKTALD